MQRGYAPTSVPADGQYQGGALAADLIALHEALGGDGEAVLIGHDFCATADYGAAAYAPNRWRKVVTIAIPPARAMAEKIMSYDQLRRSWYAYFFQNPMADKIVAADTLAFVDRFWKDWSPDYDATRDLPEVKAAMKAPEHLAAAIGYYRSMFGAIAQDEKLAQIQEAIAQPTPQPAHADRWQAVRRRDRGAAFIFAVETTGVACRPGCPSRTPREEHVRYFDASGQRKLQGSAPASGAHRMNLRRAPIGSVWWLGRVP